MPGLYRLFSVAAACLIIGGAFGSDVTNDHRSSVFITPSAHPSNRRMLPVFDSGHIGTSLVLSPNQATHVFAYLTGYSRAADLSSIHARPQSVSDIGSSWLFNGSNNLRHVIFYADGLDPIDLKVSPSFNIAGDYSSISSNGIAHYIHSNIRALVHDSADAIGNDIKVDITELDALWNTLRGLSQDSETPRFTSVHISGIQPDSEHYSAQVLQIKEFIQNVSKLPSLTSSLVARAVNSAQSEATPPLTPNQAQPNIPFNLTSGQVLIFPDEAECNAQTQLCLGRGTCQDRGNSEWLCQCNPGFLGNACLIEDVTTQLWLTLGVAVALIATAVGGVLLLVSAAPLDPASAVGVAHSAASPATSGGPSSTTRAD